MCKNIESKIAEILLRKKLTISTAESCTGGLISSLLTDISGSSNFVKSNFVTYANEAKMKYLSVKEDALLNYGAVSEIVAKQMAEGLLVQAGTDIAISITGIAGPTGGSKEKPVGLAYVGISNSEKIVIQKIKVCSCLPRKLIKFFFAKKALKTLLKFLEENYEEN